MLTLTVDGQMVDLGKENVTFERYNPLLEHSTVRGSRVINFELPATDRNNRIFKHLNVPTTPHPKLELKAKIRFFENVAESGFVRILKADKHKYTAVFTSSFGEIFGSFGGLKLQDMDLGSMAIPGTLNANPTVGTDVVAWPMVKNAAMYGQNSYSGNMNNYSGGVYTAGPKVPMLFVHKVLGLISTLTGVSFSGSFMTDSRMARLLVVNTFSLDGQANIKYTNHLPEMTIREFVMGLCKMFNVTMFIDPIKKNIKLELADAYFLKKNAKDWSRKFAEIRNRESLQENRLRLSMKLDGGDGTLKTVPVGFLPYMAGAVAGFDGDIMDISTEWCGVVMNAGLPEVSMEGVSNLYGQEGRKFGARLMFWNGLLSGVPQASDTHGGLRIGLGVANGLQTLWTAYEKFLLKTTVTEATTVLNGYELSLLDMHGTAAEHAQIYVQGKHYIIGEQRVQRRGIWTGRLYSLEN
jgi:hypothetical protein